MHRAHEVGERFGRYHILDPHRNKRNADGDRALDLAADLSRIVGVLGKDQHHGAALIDRLDDGGAPLVARRDVTRRDPASDAGALERRAGGVGFRIFAGTIIGLVFFLLGRLFSYLGIINDWPPLFSAAFPVFAFVTVAVTMLWWLERR